MRFGAILADPPWSFKTWSSKGTGRGAVSHYETMSLAEIKALPVGDLAADDAGLFCWCPDNMLEQGLAAVAAWGFTFKNLAFVWAKTTRHGRWHFGTGYWTRANPELCVFATRGRPMRLARNVRKLIIEPVREHSRKPDRVYGDIERLIAGPYVELFSRSSVPGWSVAFSDQAGLFDVGPVKTRRQPSSLNREKPPCRPLSN